MDAFVPQIHHSCGIVRAGLHRATLSNTSPLPANEVEWDEDDFDFDGVSSILHYEQRLQQLARVTSLDPSAVMQAQQVFDELLRAYIMTEDAALWPNTQIYNLLIEAMAFSCNETKDWAKEADFVLGRMKDPRSNSATPKPNLQTYGKVMDAWTRRKQLQKVEGIFEELESHQDPNLAADTYIYNKMIKAYGMAGEPSKAENLLEKLIEFDRESSRPDQKTWVHVLRAHAASEGGVEKVRLLIGRMAQGFRLGHEDWKPSAEAFNALLLALSKEKGNSKEAEAILFDMIEQFNDGDNTMRPTADSFYHVINSHRLDSGTGTAFKVEKLIELQEAMSRDSEDPLSLAPRAITTAMAAVSRARDPKKAAVAKRLLSRLEHRYEAGNSAFKPTLFAYKSVLNACAYTRGNPEERMAAFQIAVDAFNSVRQNSSLTADSKVYGLFLKACGSLMPQSKKRDAVIDTVFQKCCKDGLLDNYVLSEFGAAASEELQLRTLGGFYADGVKVPHTWSRNIVR